MKKLFFTYCILLLFIATVSSQDIPKKLYQAEKCSSPILIDGIFDEEAWKGKWEGGFIQREPIENARPSQEAQFRIVCDNENIYVAIKALDSESLSSS